jgi:outer membrane protein insertion porin family
MPRFYIFAFVITILLLSGCNPTRHLGPNENLLYKIELKGVEQNEEEQMAALYQQTPNFRIPLTGIMPYLSLYYLGKQFYNPARIERKIERTQARFEARIAEAGADSSRVDRLRERRDNRLQHLTLRKEEGNLLMRRLGEPPVIFDSLATVATADQLSIFLDSRGFFRSDVSYAEEIRDKKVYLTYQVREDQPFRYSQITHDIPDSTVRQLVQANQYASLLQEGDRYDEQVLTQERDRLENLLRNNGYIDFSRQYITFAVDTSFAPYTVRLTTQIANPPDAPGHTAYRIKDVYFTGDSGLNRFGMTRDTILFNNIHYLAYRQRFSPRILDKKIAVYPGQLFSQDRSNQTQRQLADLDMFRFNNVSYTKVSDSLTHQLNAFIQVSPSPRYQETAELGINLTERLPGPYANVRFRIRNLFRGAEVLDLGVRGGFEGQISKVDDRAIYTREFGGNASVIFPRFIIPVVRDAYLSQFNPKTRITTGYTFINRPEYTRTNFETSVDYLWQKRRQVLYSFSPFDVSIVNTPTLSPEFEATLDTLSIRGNPLRQSFNRAFISAVNFSRIYNDNDINQTLNARYLGTFLELGGLTQLFRDFQVGTLEMFQYARANVDYRRYYPLPRRTTFVYRAHAGLAAPLTLLKADSRVLPYDKYFFSGGGSSIRAWRPRRLGPGSYSPPFRLADGEATTARNYAQEQPGEVLLELSAEYRFHIFSYFNGAVFLDAGNVWTIRDDKTRPGARLDQDFYKEIAVGTGFGLRLDFTFLILRLDIGIKAYDPAEPEGKRFVLDNFQPKNVFGFGRNNQIAYNIGIGYPF